MVRNIIYLPDGTEVSSGIKSSSFMRCVNSGEELTIGSTCTNKVEFVLFDIGGKLSVDAGQEITVYRDDGKTRKKLGVYVLQKPSRPTANTLKLVGYDRVIKLEKDLTDWLDSLPGWPYTPIQLAQMVCTECGVTFATQSAPNEDFPIEKFHKQGVTGRMIMRWLAEICCRFCRANADGDIEFAWYTPSNVTIRASGDRYFFGNGLSYKTFTTAPIDAVQIRLADGASGALWPNAEADNAYIIADNAIINRVYEGLEPYLDVILEELQGVTYTPCELAIPACLDVDAGNIVTVVDRNGKSISAYIMEKQTTAQKDILRCKGSAERPVQTGNFDNAYQAVEELDKKLDSEGVFNRLTDNGKKQGIYMEDGQLYINGAFIKAGTFQADVIKLLTGEDGRPYFGSWSDLNAFIMAEVDTMDDYTQKAYSLILDDDPINSSCVLELARGRNVDMLRDVIVTLISKDGMWLRYAEDEGNTAAKDWYWHDWVVLGDGATVIPGAPGKSAYEIAVDNGFEGTEEEWLESLKGGSSGGGDVLLGQTPYTMKESASVKLVGSGEHTYRVNGKTIADLSTFGVASTKVKLTEGEDYIELVSTGSTNWYESYATFSVSGLTVGTAYILSIIGLGIDTTNLINNGYFLIKNASGTELGRIMQDAASIHSVEFTPDTANITIGWYPAANYYWNNNYRTARIADIYINAAADGTTRTDVLNESGTFTDSFVLGQVSAGVTITTDPSCQVYKVVGSSGGAALPLEGKKVVCFGDSLFGMYTGDTSAPAYVAERTGATVYNVGFGGCRMSVHPYTGYGEFSMWALAKAIATGDWSAQDAAAASGSANFPDQLAILKGIDFSDVDYIVIHYGTNDFTAGAGVAIDNASDPKDYNTLCGALRYSIETLLSAYPELRIFVSVPAFRYWTADDGTITYPEDYTNVNGNTLPEFVDALARTAKEYNLPVIDSYYGLGINKVNAATFLADGVHHNVTGRKRFGDFIGSCLVAPPVRLSIDTITAKVIASLPIYNGEVEEE